LQGKVATLLVEVDFRYTVSFSFSSLMLLGKNYDNALCVIIF